MTVNDEEYGFEQVLLSLILGSLESACWHSDVGRDVHITPWTYEVLGVRKVYGTACAGYSMCRSGLGSRRRENSLSALA